MTTEYDIGDIVLLPFRINVMKIYGENKIHYSVSPVGEDPHTGVISESQIVGALNDRKIPKELLDKKVDLIKQLREANGFSYEEISMIMNLGKSAVREILSNDES